MRADRLVAILLQLQARGRVTAAQVAEEQGVSLATARRDLEALSTAGIPVYSQPGRGGGWKLVGGARTDLSGLSEAEVRALFLLAGPASVGPGTAPEVTTALRKLVRALPETFRNDAEAASGATITDPSGWGEQESAERSALVAELQAAVVKRRKVRILYLSASREQSERLVDPWGLIDKDEVWYLIAGTSQGRRTFRVDRIRSIVVTPESAARPTDFELAREWHDVVEEIEQRRSRTWATLLVEERYLPILRHHFGRHCHVLAPADGHRVKVQVAAPTALDLARNLAGWGDSVEVTEPDTVRAILGRIGTELAKLYQPEA